tara:strand:+ start:2786 stop:3415 length:630 start_codon:yes stop_codon:yes gene_type:complete
VGDTLDLDIVQDGQNNTIGTSLQDVVLGSVTGASDSMTFSITQTGNANAITAQILGTSYTGTWDILGSNNEIDLLCSSAAAGDCETVTLNINADGDNQDYTINIGAIADASNSTINFTVDDSGNIITTDVDGTSASITVVIDSNASLDAINSTLDIDVSGNGDVNGHTIDLDLKGRGHAVVISQSGIYDNLIDLDASGDGHAINITQSD